MLNIGHSHPIMAVILVILQSAGARFAGGFCLLLGYFFLVRQEKVTSCRATPDDVGFDFESPRGQMCPPYMLKNAVFTWPTAN